MQSCSIFSEVTATVAKDFLTRIKKNTNFDNLKQTLAKEVQVIPFRNDEEDLLQIRGDLEGINKSFALLQSVENSLTSLEIFNYGLAKSNPTQGLQRKDIKYKSTTYNCPNSICTPTDLSKVSYMNHQHGEKFNSPIYTENLSAQINTDRQEAQSTKSEKGDKEWIISKEISKDTNKVNKPIRSGDSQESETQFSVTLGSIIQCDSNTKNINSQNHESLDPVENLLQCLSESKAASPKNAIDYSTWSFQKTDENTFIATEEYFDYSSICLSDMYESEINEKSVNDFEGSKLSCNPAENDKLNCNEAVKTTEKYNQDINVFTCKRTKVSNNSKSPSMNQYRNGIVGKEDLDRLDRMIESINKNQSNQNKYEDKSINEDDQVYNDSIDCCKNTGKTKSDEENFHFESEYSETTDGNRASNILQDAGDKNRLANGNTIDSKKSNTELTDGTSKSTKIKKKVNGTSTKKVKEDKFTKSIIGTSKLKCLHCIKWFKTSTSLKKHTSTVHRDVKYECTNTDCKKYFTYKHALERHNNHVHRKLQCRRCNITFESQEKKVEHNTICGKLKKEIPTCRFCGKKYANVSNLNKHEKLHDKSSKVQCQLCNKWYCSPVSLKDHMETIHKMFACSHCDTKMLTQQELLTHFTTMHPFLTKQFSKKVCKKPIKRLPAKCPYCSKTFASKSNLGHHLRSVHEKNKIKCVDCEKTFSRRDHLQRHQKIAHEKLNYPCTFCNIVYPNRATLAKHQKAEHKQLIMDQCYQCETCGQTFLYECNLGRHIKRDHKGVQFSCPKCDIQFHTSYRRDEHIQVVHEGKQWSCDHCAEVFRDKLKLRYHIKNNHSDDGLSAFNCDVCDESFSTKAKLSKHKANNRCRDAIIVKANVQSVLLDDSINITYIQNDVQRYDGVGIKPLNYDSVCTPSNIIHCKPNVSSINLDKNTNNCSARYYSTDTSQSEATTDILQSVLESHGIGPSSVFDNMVPVDLYSAFNVSHNSQLLPQVPSQPVHSAVSVYKDVSDSSTNSIYASLIPATNKKNCNVQPEIQYSEVSSSPDFLL